MLIQLTTNKISKLVLKYSQNEHHEWMRSVCKFGFICSMKSYRGIPKSKEDGHGFLPL